jgi:hypothetical protein
MALRAAAAFALACAVSVPGCAWMTDAATRLAEDIVQSAGTLRRGSVIERTLVHHPKVWPYGCRAGYTITLQESLHHPSSGGSLLIGCQGDATFAAHGYSYSTSYHLTAVRVPHELSVAKQAGESVEVTLRKRGEAIELVGLN